MFGPCMRCAGIADMMAHPAGPRRKYGDIGAAFLLNAQLVGGDAFTDFVIRDGHHTPLADVVGICRNGLFLGVAPCANAGRGSGIVAVTINDHGSGSCNDGQLENCFSMTSMTCIAGRHWARLEFGSRPSRIAAMNSRSISSMPLVETSTLLTSICLSWPSNRSS